MPLRNKRDKTESCQKKKNSNELIFGKNGDNRENGDITALFCLMWLLLLQVTEKTDAYMDNLRVALELWEKQLIVGGEVDTWAGAKLVLFAESHPFNNEQQVLAMRVRSSIKAS